MKTHFKKLKNTNFVGSWDLLDENGKFVDKIVTITKTSKEMVHDGQGGQAECAVAHLKECKPLIMNSTNLKAVAKAIGSDFTDDWEGKQITLTVKRVKAFGDFHDAIRVALEAPKLPELTPEHEKWESAKEALKSGKTTIKAILTKYQMTDENITKIQN
jgi:hypothetical protein